MVISGEKWCSAQRLFMFIGQYNTKLTDKGRVAIPFRFREEAGKKLVICRWYERSLALFSTEAWKKIIDVAVGESQLTSPARDTERFLLGGAYEIELDAQGRFVIPKALREYAQINQTLVFIGLRDRVELWDKTKWEVKEKEILGKAEELIKQVQESKFASIKGVRS